jgi:hypothetical protein
VPGAVCLVLGAMVLSACSLAPAARERAHADATLRAMPEVLVVTVGCAGMLVAGDGLCADVVTKDGAELRFERVGFNAFGANAVNVVVARAGGLVPRVASCTRVAPPNFHRDGALGHHFAPTLIDVKEAVTRAKEVLEEIEYWPRCPQFWEVQDKRGENYRYCARRADAGDEPPAPEGCQSSESAK